MAAVATLVALLGAMFVSVGSAGAAPLSPARPDYYCYDMNGDAAGGLVTATAGNLDNDVTSDDHQVVNLTIETGAVAVGPAEADQDATVSGCPTGVAAEEAVYVVRKGANNYGWSATQDGSARLVISFSDTDGVIPNDGSGISVTVDIVGGGQTHAQEGIQAAALEWIRVSGELDGHETFDTDNDPTTAALASVVNIHEIEKDDRTFKIVVPKGTTAGEYTVSASVTFNDASANDDDDKNLTDDEPFTVGDAGTNVSSATLSLASGQSDTIQAGTTATVKFDLSILNSLGKASNVGTGNAAVPVLIVAPGGDVAGYDGFDGDDEKAVMNKVSFTVGRATPGMVSVKAIVVGGSVAETAPITLTFTGPQDSVSLSDATSTLLNQKVGERDNPKTTDVNEDDDPRDSLTLTLTAADSAGNAVSPTKVANSANRDQGPRWRSRRHEQDRSHGC